MRRLLCLAGVAVLLTGCTAKNTMAGLNAVAGTLELIAALTPPEPVVVHEREVVYVHDPPLPAPPPPPPPASTRDVPPSPLDMARTAEARTVLSARRGLAEADTTVCRHHGAPRGYGHASVTFGNDGRVQRVVIDQPPGLPQEAVKCLGDALSSARSIPFSGAPITIGTTWFGP
jgi:hypothetical protein